MKLGMDFFSALLFEVFICSFVNISVQDYSMAETHDIPLNWKLIYSLTHILLVQTRIQLNHMWLA